MKKLINSLFAASLLLVLTACGGPGESAAEFDGGYIWAAGDKYVVLNEVKASSTQIAKGGMSIAALMRAPKYYFELVLRQAQPRWIYQLVCRLLGASL